MSNDSLKEALRQIEAGAKDVRTAGTELAHRIQQFELWLNKLPGRVEASVNLYTDPRNGESELLVFKKEGKEWALFLCEDHPQAESNYNWRLLRDAKLEEKIQAIGNFHHLLRNMAEAQKTIVKRVEDANSEFDNFAKSIGIKEGA